MLNKDCDLGLGRQVESNPLLAGEHRAYMYSTCTSLASPHTQISGAKRAERRHAAVAPSRIPRVSGFLSPHASTLRACMIVLRSFSHPTVRKSMEFHNFHANYLFFYIPHIYWEVFLWSVMVTLCDLLTGKTRKK